MACVFCLDVSEEEGCQFSDVPEGELISFADQEWCPFHLPLEAGGKKSEKGGWDEEEIKTFNEKVFAIVEGAQKEGKLASLDGVVFPGDISFKQFLGDDKASQRVRFHAACFHGATDFRDVHFHRSATFRAVHFRGEAEFDGAYFHGHADFDRAHFHKRAFFQNVHFHGPASFFKAHFHESAWFGDAHFHDEAYFGDTIFHGVNFSCDTRSNDSSADEAESSFKLILCYRAVFDGPANFTNRRFLSTTDFSGATFTTAPQFHNCIFHPDTNFSRARFLDHHSVSTGILTVDAVRAYRTLKRAMAEAHATHEQARFFREEQESLRHRKDTPNSTRFFLLLYKVSADYGQSIWRPLLWLLGVFSFFFLIYYGFLTSGKQILVWQDLWDTLEFAFKQVFLPFRVFLKPSAGPTVPLVLALIATLHSVLNLSFLALFFIALRRRFRLA